jgi:general secretion pathway protein C
VTFGVWVGVTACAAFWALKVFVRPLPVPATSRTVADAQVLRGDWSLVLGSTPEAAPAPVVAASSRFKLIGVVAPRAERAAAEGLALIAIDGKPPKAYRVGAAVDGDLVLQRVHARGAELGARDASGATVALDVPPLPPPATGRPGLGGPSVAAARPLAQPRPLSPSQTRPRPPSAPATSYAPPPPETDLLGEDDAAALADEEEAEAQAQPPIRPPTVPPAETQ